jgi:hypothetical protein
MAGRPTSWLHARRDDQAWGDPPCSSPWPPPCLLHHARDDTPRQRMHCSNQWLEECGVLVRRGGPPCQRMCFIAEPQDAAASSAHQHLASTPTHPRSFASDILCACEEASRPSEASSKALAVEGASRNLRVVHCLSRPSKCCCTRTATAAEK